MMSGVRDVPRVVVVVVVVAAACWTTTHAQTSSTGPPCVDSNLQCPELAKQGRCDNNPEVLTTCRLSCKSCDIPNLPWPTIADPDFDCGRPYVRSVDPSRGRRRRAANANPGPQVNSAPVAPERTNTVEQPGELQPQVVTVQDIFCGATPISDRFLLTSAYCVLKKPIYSVRLGELDFSKDNEANSRPVDYAVEQIFVHPDFNPNTTTRYNDLALIQTVQKIEFNDVVFPYCLPGGRPPPNTEVIGSGFGYVNATHQSPILQEADLLVMTLSECEAKYQADPIQWELLKEDYPSLLQGSDLMCAGFPGRGPCKGDEGGPLYADLEDRRFLLGIASFTGTCGEDSIMPGVYMSVADHIDFIDSVLYGF